MPKLARREFLSMTAALLPAEEKPQKESVTASATRDAVPRIGLVVSSFKGGQEMDGTKVPGLADPQPADAVLTDAQLEALVLKAMELGQLRGGGSRRFSRSTGPSEDWVVMLVRGDDGPPGSGTDPRVARTVLRAVVERGRGRRYTIARGSARRLDGFSDDWQRIVADMKRLAPVARFELVDLNRDEWLEAPTLDRREASRNPAGMYAVAKTIRQCDTLINVAPLATDPLTGVALAAGNFWGIAPGEIYGYPKKKLLALGAPDEVLVDLYLHQTCRFNVLGGSMAMEGEGDTPVRHNVVVAGSNITSVDAVGAAVMGFDPDKLPILDRLEKRGLGVRDIYSIWTRGNEVDQVRREFRRPVQWGKS